MDLFSLERVFQWSSAEEAEKFSECFCRAFYTKIAVTRLSHQMLSDLSMVTQGKTEPMHKHARRITVV